MEFLTQPGSRSWSWLAGLMCLMLCVPVLQCESDAEYDVKAAFLYKFAAFVEWPDLQSASYLDICISGQDPFGGALDRVIKGKSVNGREFLIRRLRRDEEAGECQILFISSSERKHLRAILGRLQRTPVLTVGDVAGFCESGGAVNLTVANHRVQLEINPGALEHARLQLSSRLMSLARIVRNPSSGKTATP